MRLVLFLSIFVWICGSALAAAEVCLANSQTPGCYAGEVRAKLEALGFDGYNCPPDCQNYQRYELGMTAEGLPLVTLSYGFVWKRNDERDARLTSVETDSALNELAIQIDADVRSLICTASFGTQHSGVFGEFRVFILAGGVFTYRLSGFGIPADETPAGRRTIADVTITTCEAP